MQGNYRDQLSRLVYNGIPDICECPFTITPPAELVVTVASLPSLL